MLKVTTLAGTRRAANPALKSHTWMWNSPGIYIKAPDFSLVYHHTVVFIVKEKRIFLNTSDLFYLSCMARPPFWFFEKTRILYGPVS